jgi:serine/threonine protein phosphatase PrpC
MSQDEVERQAARRAALSPLLASTEFRPLSASVKVEIGAHSARSSSPRLNDDHYLVLRLGRHQETIATSLSSADLPPLFHEQAYAMLVADGLGEEGSGAVASRLALSTIAHMALHYGQWNLRIDPKTASEIVERAEWFYSRADAAVANKTRTSPSLLGMAAALTMAYSAGDDLFIAHVGHTRVYLFRDGKLIQLTRDQTVARQLETQPSAKTTARAQDLSHILTDALGAGGSAPEVSIEQYRLIDADIVMLSTNGLTDALSTEEIAEVLSRRRKPQETCVTLAELANEAEGHDSATVVIAQYSIPAF